MISDSLWQSHKTMKYFLIVLSIICAPLLHAQSDSTLTQEQAVINTIRTLFDGMRTGDSLALRSVLHPNAHLQSSYTNKAGNPVLSTGSIDKWVSSVGTPHEEVYDEKIWSYKIRIDDNLASAWTDYTFYVGEKQSHCGVNAFHLVHTNQGWKISHIIDTRRKTNCQTAFSNAKEEVNTLMDNWHKAAATADEAVFFGSMTPDGIYIGTDAEERWGRDEMATWSKEYFEKDSAWDFTTLKRTVYLDADEELAWFEESLDTWMGECRASGVVTKTTAGWKIKHYHLSVTVPNDNIDQFLPIATPSSKKKAARN